MILRIHSETPQKRTVRMIQDALQAGEILILPTDSVYAFVCSLDAPRSINEIYRLKGIPEGQHLSLLCRDVAMAGKYAQTIPGAVFRFMKTHTPGPFTFILKANRNVDRRGVSKRKTVGVRIVDHPLFQALMEEADTPLISSSITDDSEYFTDPEALEREYGKRIYAVVDDGIRGHEFTTVLDCTESPIQLVRQGKGEVESLRFMDDEE